MSENQKSYSLVIGARLKAARQTKGLSQLELANQCFVNQAYISQFENDLRWPKDDTLKRLAEVLGVKVVDFGEYVEIGDGQ